MVGGWAKHTTPAPSISRKADFTRLTLAAWELFLHGQSNRLDQNIVFHLYGHIVVARFDLGDLDHDFRRSLLNHRRWKVVAAVGDENSGHVGLAQILAV